MTNLVYYDSGTTNTRAYLLRDGRVLTEAKRPVGSKLSALQGSNRVLLNAMKELYDEVLEQGGLGDGDIEDIYVSGMASCPSGVVEVPHLPAPLSCPQLAQAIHVHREEQYFRRELKIIPGMKNLSEGESVSLNNVSCVNNVRGEEIQVMGILEQYRETLPASCAIILPGSHTQTVFVQDGSIVDLLATITGELFHAIGSNTIIGSSLGQSGGPIDEEMVRMGYDNLYQYGFNRALYITRAMELFADTDGVQRSSYLEGVINGGVIHAIQQVRSGMDPPPACLAIDGKRQYQVFSAICKTYFPHLKLIRLEEREVPFSVKGLYSLLEHRTQERL